MSDPQCSETDTTLHDPGTPDDDVTPMRLRGRLAYRLACRSAGGRPRAFNIEKAVPVKRDRLEWWLGWYDERLRKWFGR